MPSFCPPRFSDLRPPPTSRRGRFGHSLLPRRPLARESMEEGECTVHRLTRFPKRSEEHTSVLQSPCNLVCRRLLEKEVAGGQPRRSMQFPSVRVLELVLLGTC